MAAVSVLMPVYNADTFIKETMDSILSQTFQDFELLVMDDGSTDRSAEIIHSYSDPRIRYVLCPHDYISTLNKGIEMAQGNYIARMDADDIMMPERLQTQFDYMEANPDIAACGAYMQTFGYTSKTITVLIEHEDIIQQMLIGNPISNPTGFIRKEVLIKYDILYREGYFFADDYKFWTEIAKVGKLANIPKILVKYRTHNKQVSVARNSQMMATSRAIQYEMLQYFLDAFSPSGELGNMVAEKVLPGIKLFNEKEFFSQELYLKFMYELIHGLRQRGNFKI
jgi:glycosyltransferase involved in cell wall biosynthesis